MYWLTSMLNISKQEKKKCKENLITRFDDSYLKTQKLVLTCLQTDRDNQDDTPTAEAKLPELWEAETLEKTPI